MKHPGRMICRCDQDLGPTGYDEETDTWTYACPDCLGVDGPLTIEISGDTGKPRALRDGSGIMAELGLYDGLKDAISRRPGSLLEFAVVEHLYASVDPSAYRELVDRYGHVAIEPDTNTASWMLGRALWALQREGEVVVRGMPKGTGRWSYLSPCNAWALGGTASDAPLVTWAEFAEREGLDPYSHPAIGWRPTPNAAEARSA